MESFTENPYAFTTRDRPFNLRLFCGRTKDVESIMGCFGREESIALFGERRIGKTLLLFILRDLINDAVPSERRYQLIDTELDSQWEELCKPLGKSRAVCITLQRLPVGSKQASELLQSELQKACEGIGLHISTEDTLVGCFESLVAKLEQVDTHLIILVDEIENLNRFEDSHQLLDNLRSIIEAHSGRLCFLFAGAELWYQDVKSGSSPLASNLQKCYLGNPDLAATRRFLIYKPFSNVLGEKTADRLSHDIVEKTGGKPWFVQMICWFLWQHKAEIGNQTFERIWNAFLRDEVEKQARSDLEAFRESRHSSAKRILEMLSIVQPLGVRQLANGLRIREGEVFTILDDLEKLDRVRSQKGFLGIVDRRYEFSDEITRAYWQERARGLPKPFLLRRVLGKVIKWSVVGALLTAALILYFYTYPTLVRHSIIHPEYLVEAWYPPTVEEAEGGNVRVIVANPKSAASSITVTTSLSSDWIDFHTEGSNAHTFKQITPGEEKMYEFSYLVYTSVPVTEILTELAHASAEKPPIESFFASRRRPPIKRYLLPFEGVLTALVAVIMRKEIAQLAGAVFAAVSASESNSSSEE